MGPVPPPGTVSARRAGLLRSHGAGGCAVVRRIRRTCRRPLVWVLCAASGTDVLSVFLARRLVWLLSQRLLDAAGHCMRGGGLLPVTRRLVCADIATKSGPKDLWTPRDPTNSWNIGTNGDAIARRETQGSPWHPRALHRRRKYCEASSSSSPHATVIKPWARPQVGYGSLAVHCCCFVFCCALSCFV